MVRVVGYARVSTSHQTTDGQRDALTAAGCHRIFEDVMSGARVIRPGLAQLLDHVRDGDVVVVVALDRLGRSLSGIVQTIEQLQASQVALRSLREGIDTTTSSGRMVAGIFASLAEYERELIKERADAAREAARLRGRTGGRARALNEDKLRQARALRAGGESPTAIAKSLGVGRSTVYRYLAADEAA